MLISIIIPVYCEELSLEIFFEKIYTIINDKIGDYEIIFALDPSSDKTEDIIIAETQRNSRIKLLKFSRRFGQPMAILAGLTHAQGDAIIVMDVDLQDPPELIPLMIEKWHHGFDVVIPQRISRQGEPFIKKLVSALGYKIIKKIAKVDIPPNTGDYRLMSKRVVSHLINLKESHGFLRGMVAIVGFKQILLPFHRPPRSAGQTNYNPFFGSLRIGFNGIFGFSSYALTLSTQCGFIIALGSFLLAIVYTIMKFNGANFPLGNPTLVILILFLGGIQLISVGILGEYIGRIYEEVRERPKFIIDYKIGFKNNL